MHSFFNEKSINKDNSKLDVFNIKPECYSRAIYEFNENAINLIYSENFDQAYMMLLSAHSFLQKLKASANIKNAGIIILTHHNLSLCYQKLL